MSRRRSPLSRSGLFRDPFFDPYCWANCTGNAFVVRSLPDLSRAVVVADRWLTVVLAVAVVIACAVAGGERLAVGPTVPPALWPPPPWRSWSPWRRGRSCCCETRWRTPETRRSIASTSSTARRWSSSPPHWCGAGCACASSTGPCRGSPSAWARHRRRDPWRRRWGEPSATPTAPDRLLAARLAALRRRVRAAGHVAGREPWPGADDVGPRRPAGRRGVPRRRRARDRVRHGRRVHAGAGQRAAAGRGPRPGRGAARLAQPDRRDRGPRTTAARARPPRRSPATTAYRVVRDPGRDRQRRLLPTTRRRPRCWPARSTAPRPRSTSCGRSRRASTPRSSARPVSPPPSPPWPTPQPWLWSRGRSPGTASRRPSRPRRTTWSSSASTTPRRAGRLTSPWPPVARRRLVVTVEDDGPRRTDPLVRSADRIGALGGTLEIGPRSGGRRSHARSGRR